MPSSWVNTRAHEWSVFKSSKPCLIYMLTLNDCIPVIWQSQETRIPQCCESICLSTLVTRRGFLTDKTVRQILWTLKTSFFGFDRGRRNCEIAQDFLWEVTKNLSILYLLFTSKSLTKLQSSWSSMNCKKGELGKSFV